MECPHLSSSVCIAPDSAKFPNGSPSSWCCSGYFLNGDYYVLGEKHRQQPQRKMYPGIRS
ncbi:hypothetical protein FD754_020439 [Muntiacus muntjak]|uniref:Uncharacterized protein n=1 Tax=Muntiacus muntjak TaxID=9888 RepID=A0A5N3V2Y8_MUNMU|nr:hypothetical protein FD754_020439 [Muntiacus muntjak]